eukprot:TRINITY_DN20883_c0_g1_i2.p1 TRINITY_DN20883_c0_g1~~TRINITY_DN20883_c0_g1_i2.p1  ORF type:complete len:432 (+),score=45.86 TRINITY_DN20883_c0_g1_i2:50-1345(+)
MPPPQKWIVIDNGFNAKVCKSNGLLTTGPNAVVIRRSKGGEVRTAHDEILKSSLGTGNLYWLRATTKGFLSDVQLEAEVWSSFLSSDDKKSTAVVTSPILSPPDVIYGLLDLSFENFAFAGVHVVPPQLLSLIYFCHKPKAFSSIPAEGSTKIAPPSLTGVIVDFGSTCTYIISYFKGEMISKSLRRVPVGGQTLTGHIQLTLARRNPYIEVSNTVAEAIKERACFVAPEVSSEVKRRKCMGRDERKQNRAIYSLPDGHAIGDPKGFLVPKDKLDLIDTNSVSFVNLDHELYTVPEMLFHPESDTLGGITEGITESINSCPKTIRPELWSSVIATGGGCRLRGLMDRLYTSLRSAAPSVFPVVLYFPSQHADQTAVRGGVAALHEASFRSHLPKQISASSWSSVRGNRTTAVDLINETWTGLPLGDSDSSD